MPVTADCIHLAVTIITCKYCCMLANMAIRASMAISLIYYSRANQMGVVYNSSTYEKRAGKFTILKSRMDGTCESVRCRQSHSDKEPHITMMLKRCSKEVAKAAIYQIRCDETYTERPQKHDLQRRCLGHECKIQIRILNAFSASADHLTA